MAKTGPYKKTKAIVDLLADDGLVPKGIYSLPEIHAILVKHELALPMDDPGNLSYYLRMSPDLWRHNGMRNQLSRYSNGPAFPVVEKIVEAQHETVDWHPEWAKDMGIRLDNMDARLSVVESVVDRVHFIVRAMADQLGVKL